MEKSAHSRKNFLSKPSYQIKFALTLFAYIAFFSIVLGFVIFYPLYMELNSTASLQDRARVSELVLYLHKRIWPGLLVVAFLAGIHSIFSTHRLVGPVVRFEYIINELINGNYGVRIRIRKRDAFKEVEELLNRLAGVLETRRMRDAHMCIDVKARLESVSAMLEAEGARYPEDVKRLIQEMIRDVEEHTKSSA